MEQTLCGHTSQAACIDWLMSMFCNKAVSRYADGCVPPQKHPCLQFDSIVTALRPKSLVGISQIGLILIAAYDGLHLSFHLCQLLRVPENDLEELLLQPREMILLQNDTVMISHAKQHQVPSC